MTNWKEVFYYDETSPSCLRWACNIPRKTKWGVVPGSFIRVVGDAAGTLTYAGKQRRYKVKYQQQVYMAHRVVYQLFHGTIPDDLVIDHIDGDCSNNVISNLRLVTHEVNARNTGKRSSNKTGVNGVTCSEVVDRAVTYKYYCALWTIGGKNHYKYFSVTKYGEEEAFRLACEYRAAMIEQLNSQGAGYTDTHGKRNSQT